MAVTVTAVLVNWLAAVSITLKKVNTGILKKVHAHSLRVPLHNIINPKIVPQIMYS